MGKWSKNPKPVGSVFPSTPRIARGHGGASHTIRKAESYMNEVVDAAVALVRKMAALGTVGIWYEESYQCLVEALKDPLADAQCMGTKVEHTELSGAEYWSVILCIEITELAEDPNRELPELNELICLLKAEELSADARTLSVEEKLKIVGAVPCPRELNNRIAHLLRQKIRSN
jgi:hypothetical protein